MKLAAADAMASLVGDYLDADDIVPDPFDPRLAQTVATAVAQAAIDEGVIRSST